jgi:nitrogenase molybdenum-iron protein alpha chain
MSGAAFIMHSPLGCSGCVGGFNQLYHVGQFHDGVQHIKNARYIATNLDERDVILGGEQKLTDAVLEAQRRYTPDVIFILTSCVSGIIGDDVDTIAAELDKQVSARVIPIHCEGFRSKLPATGFDAAFNAIKHYILPKPEEVTERDDNLINIFAPMSMGIADQKELARLVEPLGLVPNFIPFYASLEKLRKIVTARVSASICQVFADEFVEWLGDTYGIPYAITCMPLGVKSTDAWLTAIAEKVGKEAEAAAFIASEHARVAPQIAEVRERLQGKTAYVSTGTGRAFAAAALVEDYGMKLAGLRTRSYETGIHDNVERLTEQYGGQYLLDIAHGGQGHQEVSYLKKLKPDLIIGAASGAHRLGIPVSHVLDAARPTLGYSGILYVGRKLAEAIENTAFIEKLAQHRRPPYKDSWYDADYKKFNRAAAGSGGDADV